MIHVLRECVCVFFFLSFVAVILFHFIRTWFIFRRRSHHSIVDATIVTAAAAAAAATDASV